MTKKNLVLFHGQLETLNFFTKQLQLAFEQLGYDIYLFDLQNSVQSLGKFYAYYQSHRVHAMIGFNCAFFGLKTATNVSVWEQLQIPCINILVDHPYWYRDILLNSPVNSAILCIDQNHMQFVSRFYPQIAITGFLPHGGTLPCDKLKPISARNIDILYAGSLYKQTSDSLKPDFSRWNFPAETICQDTINYLFEHTDITIEDALENQLLSHDIHLTDSELCDFISSCVYIERIVSSHFREKVLETIARSGLSLTLYGNGWEDCTWVQLNNVHYEGFIAPDEILTKMQDSKIVLNTLPWFKNGSHERVFNAMLCGAVVSSEESIYLKETLPENAWLPFSLSELSEFPIQIRKVLGNPTAIQEMANNGYSIAYQSHTWQHRAKELHEDLLQFF